MRRASVSLPAAAKLLQSCPTLCDPIDGSPPGWDSPGKNTGVGCHFLLPRMKVKSENEVTQSCPTLCDPMDYTVHGILQARILEWVAFLFSRGIFPTQESTSSLLHLLPCWWILYHVVLVEMSPPLQYSCLENPMDGGAW